MKSAINSCFNICFMGRSCSGYLHLNISIILFKMIHQPEVKHVVRKTQGKLRSKGYPMEFKKKTLSKLEIY